jgi:hypothetical protein
MWARLPLAAEQKQLEMYVGRALGAVCCGQLPRSMAARSPCIITQHSTYEQDGNSISPSSESDDSFEFCCWGIFQCSIVPVAKLRRTVIVG